MELAIIPAIKGMKIIFSMNILSIKKLKRKAISPRIKDTIMANRKEADKFPLIIFVLNLFGFIMPKDKPELSLEANVPLIFPLISRNPGRRISIPGIKRILFVYIARKVPAIRPPITEIN